MFMLIALVVITNVIFIPLLGITGAAMASFISTSFYTITRILFLRKKFGLWPFQISHIYVIIVAAISFAVSQFMPRMNSLWFDIAVRSAIITLIYFALTYWFGLSSELNSWMKESVQKITSFRRK